MRSKGLRIIAAESQGSPKGDIEKLMKKHKAEYMVTNGAQGPIPIAGIPSSVVFDTSGKIIFNGHPGDENFERAIKKALKDVDSSGDDDNDTISGPLLLNRTWTNSKGVTLKADLLEVVGTKAKLRLINGRIVLYDIDKLSKEDQTAITEATEKNSN